MSDYIILVQARSSSARLSRKVLLEVGGKPLIQYQMDRILTYFDGSKLVIATSIESSDDELASYAKDQDWNVFRGPLERVATRFYQALQVYPCQAFFRVCADSPCYDPKLMLQAGEIYEAGQFDIVTNCFPRSFPKGFSTELINSNVFKESYQELCKQDDNEIFTQFYYRNPTRFRIHNFQCPKGDFSTTTQCVDTAEDLERFKRIISAAGSEFINLDWQKLTLPSN